MKIFRLNIPRLMIRYIESYIGFSSMNPCVSDVDVGFLLEGRVVYVSFQPRTSVQTEKSV